MSINVSIGKASKRQTKKFTFPHIYVILFAFVTMMAIASLFVPAGEYERVEGPMGRLMINPEVFSFIEGEQIGIMGFLTAIPNGMVGAAPVVFFTFMIGGTFMVLNRTGIIAYGVDRLTRTFMKQKVMVIPVLVVTFSMITAFIGTPELSLVYVPILIPLMIKLGYNRMLATGVALTSTTGGFLAALTNPGTVGLSQQIAELPIYSGVGFRLMVLATIVLSSVLFLMFYAKKLENHPEQMEYKELVSDEKEKTYEIGSRGKVAGFIVILMFIGMIYGVLNFQWDFIGLAGYFLAMGIIVGLVAGLSGNEISEAFNQGFQHVLMGAMIIGIARGVSIIMEQTQMIDTIIYGLSHAISSLPSSITVLGMLVTQGLFNFFVPSGSGQALITMPIMIPLADLVGTTRQTAILAFQIGDGLSNIIFPTSGYFVATLAAAKVSYGKWVKFIFPLLIAWFTIGCFYLVIAHAINWGPF
ncbi:YfcC family protein [Halalkalibacterium halodurans]|uniref:YfcC family protein n=1 Tax=Halalkalibacterium halodurans TaxID=86665 RepID=UPI002E21BBDD|nr:YfcC family protein [Halalkalibacterium halodurans]MED4085092.1 YfcC family protein [Halalkalibacterium halodurans]MED4105330.1 YfcC family protein [Halalkalibacterium halodurans]MED4109139.1 YfcC family protein [Halalkalibacterium halodurans]MED4148951.1 YfcC family protein [Halalkalibacterium halodurans]